MEVISDESEHGIAHIRCHVSELLLGTSRQLPPGRSNVPLYAWPHYSVVVALACGNTPDRLWNGHVGRENGSRGGSFSALNESHNQTNDVADPKLISTDPQPVLWAIVAVGDLSARFSRLRFLNFQRNYRENHTVNLPWKNRRTDVANHTVKTTSRPFQMKS